MNFCQQNGQLIITAAMSTYCISLELKKRCDCSRVALICLLLRGDGICANPTNLMSFQKKVRETIGEFECAYNMCVIVWGPIIVKSCLQFLV